MADARQTGNSRWGSPDESGDLRQHLADHPGSRCLAHSASMTGCRHALLAPNYFHREQLQRALRHAARALLFSQLLVSSEMLERKGIATMGKKQTTLLDPITDDLRRAGFVFVPDNFGLPRDDDYVEVQVPGSPAKQKKKRRGHR